MGMGDELTVSDLTARGTRGIPESVNNLKMQDMFSRVPSLPVTKDEYTKAKRIAKGVYCGEESRSGIPHGTGVLVSTSGHRFEGEWANGEMHGSGNCQSPISGRILYEGMWKKGKMTGQGTKKTASGVVESGDFNNGQLEGYGEKFTPGDGVRYVVCVSVCVCKSVREKYPRMEEIGVMRNQEFVEPLSDSHPDIYDIWKITPIVNNTTIYRNLG